ncbi:hypothetical protein SDC9_173977 [bioreactor metagenome]|uniref:Uncharacterized protein n=1 Tax=bioreactor metagenome TaxID=1076179 RepID=A0A645GL03_9ZZZZ
MPFDGPAGYIVFRDAIEIRQVPQRSGGGEHGADEYPAGLADDKAQAGAQHHARRAVKALCLSIGHFTQQEGHAVMHKGNLGIGKHLPDLILQADAPDGKELVCHQADAAVIVHRPRYADRDAGGGMRLEETQDGIDDLFFCSVFPNRE